MILIITQCLYSKYHSSLAMTAPDQTTSALFVAFDRNQDGRLSYEDLRQGFNKSGYRISGDELKALVDRFDTDGDGALDFPEMLTVMACLHKSNKARDDLYKIFNAMDANGKWRGTLRRIISIRGGSFTLHILRNQWNPFPPPPPPPLS